MNIDYLTVKEMAAKLRVNRSTITRGIASGYIQAFRTGDGEKSPFRIPSSELSRMAEFDLSKVIEAEVEKRLQKELEKRNK